MMIVPNSDKPYSNPVLHGESDGYSPEAQLIIAIAKRKDTDSPVSNLAVGKFCD